MGKRGPTLVNSILFIVFTPLMIFVKVTDDSNLTTSSLAESDKANDLLGVIVSYIVKVRLILN